MKRVDGRDNEISNGRNESKYFEDLIEHSFKNVCTIKPYPCVFFCFWMIILGHIPKIHVTC